MDAELIEKLIELDNIQKSLMTKARGREVQEILHHYNIPPHLYTLAKENDAIPKARHQRRTVVRINFGLVEDEQIPTIVECLFLIGQCPDFISEALGVDVSYVAQCLSGVITRERAERALKLRSNPQRFRLVD